MEYSEFERGERQALLQVRSFIAMHGKREVDAFCAQRLHDIAMDARHAASCDTRRMAETGNTDSVRSTGGAVPEGQTPND